jgi:hypothetical protein
MGRIPTVTIGPAVPQKSPTAAFGTPTAERATPLLPAAGATQKLTLSQVIVKNDDAAPVLTIHELSGSENRQVVLGGRALPFRGSLKFIGEMRIESTPYVGFPKVNQTVLGAQEQDTEMNGEWHDRFLDDPDGASAILRASVDSQTTGEISLSRTELRSARDLCVLFDDIRLSGRLLRVSWLHIARIGRLAIFEQDWQNEHDVKWRMEFDWIGKDEQIGLPSPARSSLVGLAKALNTGYVELHDATNFDSLDTLEPGFADAIDSRVGKLQRTIEDIGNAVETRVGAATNAIDAIRRAVSLAAFARDQAQDVLDSLGSVPAAAMLTNSAVQNAQRSITGVVLGQESLGDFTGLDPGKQISASCQQMAAIRAARAMRHIAARQRFQALRSLDSDVVAIVHLRAEEDLRDLARQWYGTPDDWDQIRSFNGMTSSVAPAGSLIFVPTLRAQ